jgi:ketosteroid isomerase-like protein
MKKICIAVMMLVGAMALGVAPVAAQEMNDPTLVSAVEAFRKALIDPDKATLDKLTMNELSYGHSSGLVQDKAAFEEALLSGASDFVSIELNDQTMKVVGNTAWVRHKLSAVTNDGGKPGEAHLSVLLIWMKQKGQWRLLARQAVKVAAQ